MTPQDLKNSILQLAIQGKLVEQRPEEGTAKELYQKILLERYKLQQNKKIKKVPDFSIVADNIPFEVPENWSWSNIETLTYAVGNKQNQIQTKEILPEGSLPVVSQGQSLIDGYTNQKEKAIDDLPLVMFGDHTRNVKFIDFPFAIGADGTKFHKCILVYPQYIYYWMTYASGRLRNRGYARHYVLLKEQYIPLPPLAEQKRIVAKIEEMLPYIDRYEQAWSQLEDFNKRFPTDMQKSILQMAIQGKLVEQHPEEGTGEELYQQIQAEKQQLIKAGTTRKEKPLPEIAEDEKPFDIPESWKWVRLGDLFQHNTGKALNSSDKSGIPLEYITTSNVYWNRFELDQLKTMLFTDAQIERCSVQKGDLLVLEGGDIGRAAIWNYDFPMRIQNHIHRLRPYDEICIEFFYYIFFLYKNAGLINGKGIGIQGLSTNVLHKLAIPLPPFAEQKRIVAKLEEILPLCEKLNEVRS